LGGIEEAIDRTKEGGFARTAAAEDGGGGSFVEGEGDLVEEEIAVWETEGEVSKLDGWDGQFRSPFSVAW
jgi:hypothetical protein